MKLFKFLIGSTLALMMSAHANVWATLNAGITITDASYVPSDATMYSVGYDFTPIENIIVSHLGFYDRGSNGLANTHEVGIYLTGSPGAPLFFTNVLAGTGEMLLGDGPDGFFRYHDIADYTLSNGVTYRIAAVVAGTGNDGYAYGGYSGFAGHSKITLGNGYFTGSGGSLAYPNVLNGEPGNPPYATPNFLIFTIPEPGSIGLMAVGACLLWRQRRGSRS